MRNFSILRPFNFHALLLQAGVALLAVIGLLPSPAKAATTVLTMDQWSNVDIGTTPAAGSGALNAATGTYTVTGSGADISGSTDNFHYSYQGLSGDGVITARVDSVTNTNAWTKVGVMIRETLLPGSTYAMMMVTPGSGVGLQYRAVTGSGTSVNGMTTGLTAPRWIKLERRGNVFSGYQSADGVSWILSQRVAIAMAANVNVGLVACSRVTTGTLATAVFSQVLLDPTNATMTLPWPWAESAVGTSTDQGVALYDSSYVLSNLGADIWSPADRLKLVGQSLTGDGTLVVKVSSIASSDGWSRFGLMMRETLDAGAKNVLLSLTTSNGLVFQSRSATSGNTAFVTSSVSKSAPVWLKLDRKGNTFTALYSADGVTWTTQGSAVIAMNATIQAGLAYANRSSSAWALGVGDQLKLITPLDTDGNGLADAWEMQYFGHLGVNSSTDADGDGLTNAQESDLGTNPTVATASGQEPALTVVGGNNQIGSTGAVLPQPLAVKVADLTTGAPLPGLLVTFRLSQGAGLFGTDPVWQSSVSVVSDANGLAQTSFQFPATGGGVTVQAAVGNQPTGKVAFTLKALLGASGGSFQLDSADVGTFTLPGKNRYEAGVYTLTATTGDIWNNADSFDYAWQSLAGDGLVVARVAGLSATHVSAKAGVMIRETPGANARYVMVSVTPGSGVTFQWRDTTGGASGGIKIAGLTAPKWLALRRSGGTIAGYYSGDGQAWTLAGSHPFVAAQPVTTGLALGTLSTAQGQATFDSVSVSPLAPAPWQLADVGSFGCGNLDEFASDHVTLRAGGWDIWGAADSFRYAYQPLPGDGRMVVRVAAEANTHVSAKSGLMIRDSSAAGSRYALLMQMPGSGVSLQGRAQTGGSAYAVSTLAGLIAPTWLKIERLGATIDAYKSADGQTWTKVGSINWGFGPALVGLAAASLNSSTSTATLFDNLSLQTYAGQGGWSGAYFFTNDLSGQPAVLRRDASIDFTWPVGQAPASGVPVSNYSVRWQGILQPQASDTYTITAHTNGGVRVWVDGQLVIDRWALQASATDVSGQAALQAGGSPKIKVEYFNGTAAGQIQLRWSGPAQADAVIPTGSVQPTDSDNDGIPDAWESAHGLAPFNAADALLAPDGDGLTNLVKYQLGLNPGQSCAKAPGAVILEQWQNTGGGSIGNLTSNPRFPLQPTAQWPLTDVLSVGPDIGDNYGLRIRGYIHAPVDGDYRFWVAGDDEAALWLSPTESPFDRVNIAHTNYYTAFQDFDRLPVQASKPVTLQAGHYYYFEVLQKEAGGGDHVSVAWQIPGGARQLLSTQYLATFAPRTDNLTGDGLPDAWKTAHGLDSTKGYGANGAYGDPDGDGLSNLVEYQLGTDPTKADTDGDGVSDQIEMLAGSNPLDPASVPAGVAPWTLGAVCALSGPPRAVGVVSGGYLLTADGTGVQKGVVADDTFPVLSQPMTTDFELSAQVDEAVESWWGTAALVVRSSLAPQDPAVTFSVDHLGEGWLYARPGARAVTSLDRHIALNNVNPAARSHWLKLRRQGRVITASYSADGVSWIWVDTTEIDLNDPCIVGMAAWGGGLWKFSHVNLVLPTAASGRFEDQVPASYHDILTSADPVVPGTTLRAVASYAGSAGVTTAGSWLPVGGALVSQMPKSALDYTIQLPADGVYRLELEAQSASNATINVVFPVEFSIDGQFIGRAELILDGQGNASLARVATPWLLAGAHTVHLFYDSTLSYRAIQINALRVQALDGPDADGNGRPDWVDDRLALIDTLATTTTDSYASPANIEGTTRFFSMAAVTAEGVPLTVSPAPGFGWYADVPLSPAGPVSVAATFENGALTRSLQIHWKPINLLADNTAAFPSGTLRIRQGDSLRFTAFAAGTATGGATVVVTPPNGAAPVTLTLASPQADPVIQTFAIAGTYTVTGTDSSGAAAGSLTVQVVAAAFNGDPVAGLGSALVWDNPQMPADAFINVDQGLILNVMNPLPGGGERFSLLTQNIADSYAVARLAPGGPILAHTTVHSLQVASDEQTSDDVLITYPDGSQLVGTPIILSHVTPTTTVRVDIVVSGVTFDDGTLSKVFTAADFDSSGRLYVKFIFPPGLGHSFCHRITVYDGGTLLGSF